MKIELVVFDVAGTTVFDGDAVHSCLQAALAADGVAVERHQVNEVMGLPKPVAIRRLLQARAPAHEDVDARVLAVHEDFLLRMVAHYRLAPEVREVPGASRVFRELRSLGIKVALDTGFSRTILNAVLERLAWTDSVVDATVASDEVPHGRPFPDLVWRAMELTGVSHPSNVAKVGDTPADLEEGDAAGCGLIVGVTEGSHSEAELRPWPHTHLIANVGAFPQLLKAVASVA